MLAQCEWTVRAILSSLRRSGCMPYSKSTHVRREDSCRTLLGCSHAELYVKQVATSRIADGQYSWMFNLPLCRDCKEAAEHFLGAADSAQAVLLFQLLFEYRRHRKDATARLSKCPQQCVIFEFPDDIRVECCGFQTTDPELLLRSMLSVGKSIGMRSRQPGNRPLHLLASLGIATKGHRAFTKKMVERPNLEVWVDGGVRQDHVEF